VWHETWPLALREGYGSRVFESRVLRSIFGLKGKEMRNEEWRKLNNYAEFYYFIPRQT
jgi:hypothetical protein